MNELFPRRARIIAKDSGHRGQVGEIVGRDDPRPKSHPQPGHLEWELFFFPDVSKHNGKKITYTGRPEDDGHGLGFMAYEVEIL